MTSAWRWHGMCVTVCGVCVGVVRAGLWPYLVFEAQKKFLQAQGHTWPQMIVAALVAFLNVGFSYLFIIVLDIGYLGAPFAMSCSNWLLCLGGAIACWRHRGAHLAEPYWSGWSRRCVQEWPAFLKLALPGMVMLCAEWWSFEIVALGAGWLGTVDLDVQGIMMNTVGLLFMLPLGVSVAASVRVGNLVGAGHAVAAKRATWIAIGLGAGMEVIENGVLAWQRLHWAQLFSSQSAVVRCAAVFCFCLLRMPPLTLFVSVLLVCVVQLDLAAHVLLMGVCFDVLDGTQAVLSGILRGVGKQHVGAISNVASYAFVGVPAAFLLAFQGGMGIYGLWSGLAIALVLQVTILGVCVYRIDWHAQVDAAKLRVASSDVNDVAVPPAPAPAPAPASGSDADQSQPRGRRVSRRSMFSRIRKKNGFAYAQVELAGRGQVGSDGDDDDVLGHDDDDTAFRSSDLGDVEVGMGGPGQGDHHDNAVIPNAAPLLHELAVRSAASIDARSGSGAASGSTPHPSAPPAPYYGSP